MGSDLFRTLYLKHDADFDELVEKTPEMRTLREEIDPRGTVK